ncbi:MAG: hypothetical protein R3348_03810 [Xanthomonadales bacterium]|nr:hypothetical protein [Xanthomonadales bacterium]
MTPNRIFVAFTLTVAAMAIQAESPPIPDHVCAENLTVFQDVSRIGRKDRLAANITRRHREMNAQGWTFVDMEIYTENADMEGAFLTYARRVPCPDPGRIERD